MVLPLKLGINFMASHVFGKAARHGGGKGAQLAGELGPVSRGLKKSLFRYIHIDKIFQF